MRATSLEERIPVEREKSLSGDYESEEALAGLPPGGQTTLMKVEGGRL